MLHFSRQFLRVHRVCERRHASNCVRVQIVRANFRGVPPGWSTIEEYGGLDSSIRRTRICVRTLRPGYVDPREAYATEIVSRGADGNIVLTMNCGAVIAAGVRPTETVARNYIIEILSRGRIRDSDPQTPV